MTAPEGQEPSDSAPRLDTSTLSLLSDFHSESAARKAQFEKHVRQAEDERLQRMKNSLSAVDSDSGFADSMSPKETRSGSDAAADANEDDDGEAALLEAQAVADLERLAAIEAGEISADAPMPIVNQSSMAPKRSRQEEIAHERANSQDPGAPIIMDVDEFRETFGEDWQMSQFWYSASFARKLSQILYSTLGPTSRIAFISCPTAYVGFQHLRGVRRHDTYLLEFDNRFAVLAGDQFVRYDFNAPLRLPPTLLGTIDLVVVDPPFLNADTNTLFSQTVLALLRGGAQGDGKVLLLTGDSIAESAAAMYPPFPLVRTPLQVEHAGGLSNDFGAWAWSDAKELWLSDHDG